MPKFDFSVITRNGQKVEGIKIYGQDLADAERKLRQMYLHCEISNSEAVHHDKEVLQSADIDDVLTLIAQHST